MDNNPHLNSFVNNVRTLLASLHPSNFDSLAESLSNLPFETNPNLISSFISVLFDSATDRPSFSAIYAKLIQSICQRTSTETDEDDKDKEDKLTKQFIKSVSRHFITTFLKYGNSKEKETKKTKNASNEGAKTTKILISTIGMIAELYKIQFLPYSAVKKLVNTLIYGTSLNEDVAGCLNFFFRSVGQQLDQDKELSGSDSNWKLRVLSKLQKLSTDSGISVGMQVEMADLVQLWRNRWKRPKGHVQVPVKNEVDFTMKNIKSEVMPVPAPLSPADVNPDPISVEEAKILKSITKRTKNFLNKLCEENFEEQKQYFITLSYLDNKAERISTFLNVVFEKAIERPMSASVYARMIRQICDTSLENPEATQKFVDQIRQKCHQEFTEGSQRKKELRKMETKLASSNEAEKDLIVVQLEETKTANKTRAVNFVMFIGELYKAKVLSLKAMVARVNPLFSNINDEENFVCFCALMTSVGQLLEDEIKSLAVTVQRMSSPPEEGINGNWRGQQPPQIPEVDINWMDKCFGKLREVLKTGNISSEAKVAILELIELRKQGCWGRGRESENCQHQRFASFSSSGSCLETLPATYNDGGSRSNLSYSSVAFSSTAAASRKPATVAMDALKWEDNINQRVIKREEDNNGKGQMATDSGYVQPNNDNKIVSISTTNRPTETFKTANGNTENIKLSSSSGSIFTNVNGENSSVYNGLSLTCEEVVDMEMKNAALALNHLTQQGFQENLGKKLELLKYIRECAQTMKSLASLKMAKTSEGQ